MKKVLLMLMMILLVMGTVFMTACSTDKGGEGEPQGDGGGEGTLTDWAYIEDKGKLIVGLDDTFAPMGFRDEANNLVGFDIDLANAVGEVLGVEIEFRPIVWETKELELEAKTIDCVWNGMSATEERQENMALTDKYLNNKIVIMTMNPDVKVNSVADLVNYNIVTQAGSAALETMEAHPDYATFSDKIQTFDTYDEAILALQGGRADCMVVDQVLGEYKNSKMDGAMQVCDFNFGDDFYAIGFRKGDVESAAKVSGAIQTLIDNGKAAEISEKWFGKNIVILEGYDQ